MGSSAVLLYWQYPMERQKASPNVSAANPEYHAAASAGFPHLILGRDRLEHPYRPVLTFARQSHPSEYRESLRQANSHPCRIRHSEIFGLVKLEKFSER